MSTPRPEEKYYWLAHQELMPTLGLPSPACLCGCHTSMCSRPGKAGREVEIMKTVENPGQMSSNTVGWMKLGVSECKLKTNMQSWEFSQSWWAVFYKFSCRSVLQAHSYSYTLDNYTAQVSVNNNMWSPVYITSHFIKYTCSTAPRWTGVPNIQPITWQQLHAFHHVDMDR